MQIVIDIDDDTYRYMQSRCKYQNKGDEGLSKFEEVGVAIKNGIPLPKGHGRLCDMDELVKNIVKEYGVNSIHELPQDIKMFYEKFNVGN